RVRAYVVHNHRASRLEEISGHRLPHNTQANKSNLRHESSFCSERRYCFLWLESYPAAGDPPLVAGMGRRSWGDCSPIGFHQSPPRLDKLAKGPLGGAEPYEFARRHALGLVGAYKLWHLTQPLDDLRGDRYLDAFLLREILGNEALLVSGSNGHHEVRSSQLRQVVISAQSGHQEHRFVTALLIERVSALGDGQAGLADIGFADRHLIVVGNLAQIVIQTPNHDYGEAPSRFDAPFSRSPDSGALPLRDLDDLRHREAHRSRN